MSDAPPANDRDNRQDRNVGNRGDILKHAALVALAELMAERPDLRYLETHAYRLVAPCDAGRWHRELQSLPGDRSYDRYVALETPWVEGGRYRCSVGLALDLLPGARFIVAEQHDETRRQLLAQLAEEGADYLVLDAAAAFGRLSVGQPLPCLALVDPFESVDKCWPSFSRGFAGLRGGYVAIILAFQYRNSSIKWPAGPPGVPIVATIDDAPYHLAAYATSSVADAACSALRRLAWRDSKPALNVAAPSEDDAAAEPMAAQAGSGHHAATGLPDHVGQGIRWEVFREVFADLHRKKTRVTYEGLGVVAHHAGLCAALEIGRPSSFRFIHDLPLDQQYLICRKNGRYSDKAIAQWHQEAPPGYETFPILAREDLELYLDLGLDYDKDSDD